MFNPKNLGGSISQKVFSYTTTDTVATVATAGYFKSVDVNGQLLTGESTADGILRVGDIIQVTASDKFSIMLVTVSTAIEVSANAKLTEI